MNRVHPTGDLLRFHVDSSNPGTDPYLVDLASYWLNGGCTCPHFEFQCAPHLHKRAVLTQEQRDLLPPIQCKHIISAQRYAFREWLRRLWKDRAITREGHES